MRWSPETPVIGDTDGFETTDIFGYAAFGSRLVNVVTGLEDNPVLVLDGGWGTGKTTFARQWAGLLRQRGSAVLHFDAFACDHQEDAFLAFVEEVHCFAEAEGVAEEGLHKFAAKSAKAIKAIPLATIKALGRGIPGIDVTAVAGDVVAAASEESQLQTWIGEAACRKEAVEEFRCELQQLATAVVERAREKCEPSAGDSVEQGGGGPAAGRLVVVVDELDRCRPAFALSVLERIKHVFGVPGVTFVLVANLEELRKSVQWAYGEVDSRKYLEKFYDLVVRLPEDLSARGRRSKTGRYASHLMDRLLAEVSTYDAEGHMTALVRLAENRQMSLRTMEHVVRNVAVLALGGPYFASIGMFPVAVLVSVIRAVHPGLFQRLKFGRSELLEKGDWDKVTALGRVVIAGEGAATGWAEEALTEFGPGSELADAARRLDAFEF